MSRKDALIGAAEARLKFLYETRDRQSESAELVTSNMALTEAVLAVVEALGELRPRESAPTPADHGFPYTGMTSASSNNAKVFFNPSTTVKNGPSIDDGPIEVIDDGPIEVTPDLDLHDYVDIMRPWAEVEKDYTSWVPPKDAAVLLHPISKDSLTGLRRRNRGPRYARADDGKKTRGQGTPVRYHVEDLCHWQYLVDKFGSIEGAAGQLEASRTAVSRGVLPVLKQSRTITRRELAPYCGVVPALFQNWNAKGWGPTPLKAKKARTPIRYRGDDVLDWLVDTLVPGADLTVVHQKAV